tara:strand:+ start:263 stop:1054 length:792 start_codon:yes stop_codon:yes gene_type:complete
MLLRGVVIASYRAYSQTTKSEFSGLANDGVTCDVVVLDPRYRAILRDVPVVTQSQGLNDYESWVPRATTIELNASGSLSLDGKGTPGATTDLGDVDGDHVLIGFMSGDLQRPVILGQLPHPRSNRREAANDTPYKWHRWVRGILMGIEDSGNVVLDLSAASDGSVQPTGAEIPAVTAGDVLVTLSATGKITITDGGAPETVILGETFLTDLSAGLTEVQTFINGMNIATPNLANLITRIATALATASVDGGGAPYLSTNLEVD